MAEKNAPDKVSITAFEGENFQKKAKINPNPFFLPVNPESFTQSYSVETFTLPGNIKNRNTGLGVAPPEELRLNFLIDGTNAIEGYKYNGKDHTVQGQLDLFLDTVFNRKEKIQQPYFLKVEWGKLTFPCVLGKVDLDYTMFDQNGNPLRIYVKTIFINPAALQNLTEKESTPSTVSSNIPNPKFPGRQPGVNIQFKPPLLNLPFVYPTVKTSKRFVDKPEAREKAEVENTIFCPNAGIVLLHPFLKKSFDKLGLLKEEEFRNEFSRKQAILFIHYLATGRENFLEKEQVIPNLLCGLPSDHEPEENISLDPGAKEEAVNLLQFAIKTWGALGNTSPDSLRQGFLTREGNLETRSNSLKLHLQSNSLDVLLDKLPWNISTIIFPWMGKYLAVIWR